jgi:hypothetical protein
MSARQSQVNSAGPPWPGPLNLPVFAPVAFQATEMR